MARALELAVALEIISGHTCTALCVWCLHRIDPHEELPARRAPEGGDCTACPYTGPDTFVVVTERAVTS